MTLTEFLLERIAEDEAAARATAEGSDPFPWAPDEQAVHGPVDGPSGYESIIISPARLLAECKAKRRIIELLATDDLFQTGYAYGGCGDDCEFKALRWALAHLALAYADHPDYRDEWRPTT